MLVIRIACQPGILVLWVFIYIQCSEQQSTETTCESRCTYTARAADAECTNRGLTTIPTAVDECRRAQMFDISHNSITSLPEASFTGFWQMRYLRVEENQITTITPGAFNPLRRTLRQMNLSCNHLTNLRDGIFVNMTRLDYLLLSYNQISDISPGAFQGMTRLSKLYLGDNSLTVIDPIIFRGMPNLREINLRNNMIVTFDITFIDSLGSLQKIFAHNNAIEEITGEISSPHSSMILINLSFNSINSFNCTKLENLHRLNDLYLSGNSLQTLQECRESEISTVHLENNPLNCACDRIQEFARWSRTPQEDTSPTCWTPESMRGIEVREAVIGCRDTVTLRTTTTYGPVVETSTMKETEYHRHSWEVRTEQPAEVLKTTVRVNIPIPITEEKLGEIENMAQVESESFLEWQNPLFLIVIVIGILLLVVSVLLFCILKTFCCKRHNSEDKHKRGTAYTDVENGQDVVKADINSKSDRCCRCPWNCFCSGKKGSESMKGSPDSMKNHNYERVVRQSPARNYPRQYSSESESSHTAMMRILPNGFLPSTNGMFNPSMYAGQCTCSYDCHAYGSQYSSYTDSCSDESYQMENQLNEMCDCSHGDMERHNCTEECETMLQGNTELPPPYTPTEMEYSYRQNPPPLPPLPGHESEPIYIPHTQV